MGKFCERLDLHLIPYLAHEQQEVLVALTASVDLLQTSFRVREADAQGRRRGAACPCEVVDLLVPIIYAPFASRLPFGSVSVSVSNLSNVVVSMFGSPRLLPLPIRFLLCGDATKQQSFSSHLFVLAAPGHGRSAIDLDSQHGYRLKAFKYSRSSGNRRRNSAACLAQMGTQRFRFVEWTLATARLPHLRMREPAGPIAF